MLVSYVVAKLDEADAFAAIVFAYPLPVTCFHSAASGVFQVVAVVSLGYRGSVVLFSECKLLTDCRPTCNVSSAAVCPLKHSPSAYPGRK